MPLIPNIFSRSREIQSRACPVSLALKAQEETRMDFGLGLLTFGTLGFAVAFGYLSVRSMEKLKNSGAPKSSLSRDGIEERRLAAARKA
jgi:hypothetical protein